MRPCHSVGVWAFKILGVAGVKREGRKVCWPGLKRYVRKGRRQAEGV